MKPFLEGKKELSAPAPRSRGDLSPGSLLARPCPGAAACPAHTLEVIKEGDRIVRLVITCSCGEKTEVDCIYPLGR